MLYKPNAVPKMLTVTINSKNRKLVQYRFIYQPIWILEQAALIAVFKTYYNMKLKQTVLTVLTLLNKAVLQSCRLKQAELTVFTGSEKRLSDSLIYSQVNQPVQQNWVSVWKINDILIWYWLTIYNILWTCHWI